MLQLIDRSETTRTQRRTTRDTRSKVKGIKHLHQSERDSSIGLSSIYTLSQPKTKLSIYTLSQPKTKPSIQR